MLLLKPRFVVCDVTDIGSIPRGDIFPWELQITAMLAEICQGIFLLSWVPSLEEFGQNVFLLLCIFFHIMCTYSKPGAFIFILMRKTSIWVHEFERGRRLLVKSRGFVTWGGGGGGALTLIGPVHFQVLCVMAGQSQAVPNAKWWWHMQLLRHHVRAFE